MSLQNTYHMCQGIRCGGPACTISRGQRKPSCLGHSRSEPTWSIQGPRLGEHSYKHVSWMK